MTNEILHILKHAVPLREGDPNGFLVLRSRIQFGRIQCYNQVLQEALWKIRGGGHGGNISSIDALSPQSS